MNDASGTTVDPKHDSAARSTSAASAAHSLDTLDSLVRLFDFLCYHMVLALPIQWWRGRLAFVLSCAGRYGFDESNAAPHTGAVAPSVQALVGHSGGEA